VAKFVLQGHQSNERPSKEAEDTYEYVELNCLVEGRSIDNARADDLKAV